MPSLPWAPPQQAPDMELSVDTPHIQMAQLMAPNVACVDYSMGRGEKLVGYRWDGEQRLDERKFTSVNG